MLNMAYKLVLATDATQTAVTYLDSTDVLFGGEWGSSDMQGNPLYIIVPNITSLDEVKSSQTAIVNNACANELLSGFKSSAVGAPHLYDSAIVDQLNFMQAYTISKVTNTAVPYRIWNDDGSKAFYPHTATQFETAYQDGALVKAAALSKCATLKNSIASAVTVEAVEAIVW